MACSSGRAFGRTSLEASANGCAVIITNKGGLPETVTDKIINQLNEKILTKTISELILKKNRYNFKKVYRKFLFNT